MISDLINLNNKILNHKRCTAYPIGYSTPSDILGVPKELFYSTRRQTQGSGGGTHFLPLVLTMRRASCVLAALLAACAHQAIAAGMSPDSAAAVLGLEQELILDSQASCISSRSALIRFHLPIADAMPRWGQNPRAMPLIV